MKMKRKILAICVILLLVTIPFGIVQASETYETEQNSETMSIELAAFESDEILATETVVLTEEGLVELESTLSTLIERIQSSENWEEILGIFDNLLETKGVVLSIIFKILSKFRPFRNRAFIFSRGHSYKLNPFKNKDFSIRKKFTFWHYSNGGRLKDKTIFFKPFDFKMKTLTGIQFGFMYKFTGIYIFIPHRFPEKSFTFFMGTSARINGIQILPS